jgi:hypothetical protein
MRVPKVQSVGSNLLVEHRELVSSSILGATTFTSRLDIPINGASSVYWPWLTKLANNYQFYKFRKVSFEYEPFCSTATAGELLMGVDYDPSDVPPTTEQSLSAYPTFTSGPVWKNNSVNLNTSDMEAFVKWHYVADGITANVPDAQQFNCASFYAFTNNCAGSTGVGKMYVKYLVEFKAPSLQPSGPLTGGELSGVVSPTATLPLGTSRNVSFGSSGLTIGVDSGTLESSLVFSNPGNYILLLNITGTVLTGAVTIASTNVSAGVVNAQNATVNSAGTSETIFITFTTVVANAVFLLTGVNSTTITSVIGYWASSPVALT